MPLFLKSKNLEVEVGLPGEYYSGSRFDYTGNIRRITLNKKHTFCTYEKGSYSSIYGFGLLNEFDIDNPSSYSEAKIGESFLKIGVGSLTKMHDSAYDFFEDYEKELLEIEVNKESDCIVEYSSLSRFLRGFQLKYNKRLIVEGDKLIIEYYIENIGEREIGLSEYCHNFLSIDSVHIGEDYNLEFFFELEKDGFSEFVDPDGAISITGNEIGWKGCSEKEFFIGNVNGKKIVRPEWGLRNFSSKAGITERGDFDCSKVNLWGKDRVVSPELFFKCKIIPGEGKRWKREFTFFEM